MEKKLHYRLDPQDKLNNMNRQVRNGGLILILALAAICIICGILLALPSPSITHKPSLQIRTKEALLSRPAREIVRAEFFMDGENYTLIRNGQDWLLETPEDFSLDQSVVTRVIAQCASVSGNGIDGKSQSDMDYGFERSDKRMTLVYTDGEQLMLIIGDRSPVGGYYACVTGMDRAVLVPESVVSTVFTGLNALHTVETPQLNEPLSPVYILIEKLENGQTIPVVELKKAKNPVLSGSGYQITYPFIYETDTEQTAELIENLRQIKADRYLGKSTEILEKTANGYRITMQDRTEKTVTLFLTAGLEENTTWLSFDSGRDIYRIADETWLRYLRKLDPVRLADRFAALIALERVESLEIHGMKENWLLEITSDGYLINGKPVENTAFRLFYQELCSLTVDDVAGEENEGREIWTFIYHLKGRAEPYRVVFSDLNRDYYRVIRDNNSLMMIGKNKVDAVVRKMQRLNPEIKTE